MITRKSMLQCMLAIVLSGCASSQCVAYDRERIISFASEIVVHPDATMTVKEIITVASLGMDIKRGIRREFPTRYRYQGLWYNVGFDVIDVQRNGAKEPYRVEDFANGKRVFIGNKDRILPPGTYTYTIIYNTDRQLGFFDTHDELYWNVTGNGWPWMIEKARARVILPPSVSPESIEYKAYTGVQGSTGTAYAASRGDDGVVEFSTTQPLQAREGLTIVVIWPKGFIAQPSWWQWMMRYLRDNGFLVLLWFGLIALLGFYLFAWGQARRTKKPGTIIPLFTPPDEMSAAGVGMMDKCGYSDSLFACQVVQLAVKGLLKISYESGQYTLTCQQPITELKVSETIMEKDITLMKALFAFGEKLVVAQSNRGVIDRAINVLKRQLASEVEYPYIRYNRDYIVGGVGFSCGILLLNYLVWPGAFSAGPWPWVFLGVYVLLTVMFNFLLPTYTVQGRRVQDDIDGFKLFLETTEAERLKLIGTPPTKTPELYETYLPYAMALGVEKQWARQFAPIFKRMEEQGHPYVPIWYIGTQPFYVSSFGRDLSDSFASSIASATKAPGTSSGWGGGGSSGGGGGGGGGGGW